MESHKIIQVEEKVPLKLLLPLSIQHMFAMFGASVLVPFIFGINPAIVLFMNGVGTLLFIVVTKAKSPAYLGSSFAFLAPAGVVISKMGYPYALGGFVAVGFCGCILSFIIYKCGTKWIDIVLPPAAMGPVVALIGLELSSSAANNAGLLEDKIDPKNVLVFAVTLGVAVFGNILFRGFLSVIPILIAVVAGYLTALACGILDFTQVVEASWFAIPNFQTPKFDMGAILMILPVLLVITSEHIGHQVVTSKIIGRDLLTDPGLHRSLFGDNFSTMVSGRISTDNHIWRKYRSYGSDKSIQRPCNRRGCGSVYYLFICWEIVDDDPDNSGTGYRRNLVPFIWYDRSIWSSYSGRLQSRLWKIQKPDVNIHCICNRSVRNICEYRNRVINRNGSGMCCCHGT